jgi:cytochrome P450
MDTTSSALGRTFHLLTMHQDIQEKVRQELQEARNANGGSDPSFDELMELPYLDAVCRETLRL